MISRIWCSYIQFWYIFFGKKKEFRLFISGCAYWIQTAGWFPEGICSSNRKKRPMSKILFFQLRRWCQSRLATSKNGICTRIDVLRSSGDSYDVSRLESTQSDHITWKYRFSAFQRAPNYSQRISSHCVRAFGSWWFFMKSTICPESSLQFLFLK